MWKLAKEFVPSRGPDPVAQYDTKSVGIGHRVTAKAWTVTHNQGNTEINIGLFTAAASIAPGSDSGRHCAAGRPGRPKKRRLAGQGGSLAGRPVEPGSDDTTDLPRENQIWLQVFLQL
jgi:hypothetical protein